MLVDVTPLGVTGKEAEHLLDEVGITVNKNAIPFDPLPPNTASGIRIGTPATTTRGFGPDEYRTIGELIVRTLTQRDDAARPGRRRGRGQGDLRALPGAGPAPVVPPGTRLRPATRSFSLGELGYIVRRARRRGGRPELPADPGRHPHRDPRGRHRPARLRASRPSQADPARRRPRGRRRRSWSWAASFLVVRRQPRHLLRTGRKSWLPNQRLDARPDAGPDGRRHPGGDLRVHRRPVAGPRTLAAAGAAHPRGMAIAGGIVISVMVNPFAVPVRGRVRIHAGRGDGAHPRGCHRAVDHRHDQQHQLHRRPGRAVDGRIADRGADPGRDLRSRASRPTCEPSWGCCAPCSRARWLASCRGTSIRRRCSSAPRASTRSASRSPSCPSWAAAKIAVALLILGVPIIDTFWIIVRRALPGEVALHARPRPLPPPPAGHGALPSERRARDLRAVRRSSRSSASYCLGDRRRIYAFLGIVLGRRPGALPRLAPRPGSARRAELSGRRGGHHRRERCLMHPFALIYSGCPDRTHARQRASSRVLRTLHGDRLRPLRDRPWAVRWAVTGWTSS